MEGVRLAWIWRISMQDVELVVHSLNISVIGQMRKSY